MVHAFKKLDEYFVLDVESGSMMTVSELCYLLIRNRNDAITISERERLNEFSLQDKLEAEEELQEAVAQNVLFTESVTSGEPIEYDGTIKALCLNICHDCNLRCKYCFADEGAYNGERGKMSAETAKAAIDFLIRHSKKRRNLEVDFFGGEPLLNLDVVKQTVEYARALEKKHNKNFRFTLTTNAVMLDAKTAEYLNETMSNVVISIDGRKEVHNSVRPNCGGGGSFDTCLKNALGFRAVRGDKDYYIRGTYTSQNPDFAADVLALNDLGFDQISIEPVVLPSDNPLALRPEQTEGLKEEYERLAREYLVRRQDDRWFNFFHFMFSIEDGPCEKKRLTGCGAGNEYVAVSPDGKLYPCHQFVGNPEYCMGELGGDAVDENIRKVFQAANLNSKPVCKTCWAKYYCSGGCAANSINCNGDINEPDRAQCELIKARTECAIAVNITEQKTK